MILIYICKVKKGNALVVFFRVEEASQASHTFSSDKCVICQEDFDENAPAVIVHQKGLATLIKVSEERKMLDLNKNLLMPGVKQLKMKFRKKSYGRH